MDTLVILLIVLVVVLIWRGPKTLPEIGSMLGRGVKAARDEAKEIRGEGAGTDEPDEPPAR
ncbi:MAG TPA: twin-arginine translocase TatA/TatE family subunit [Candidatus Sulfomarinibacteraceae bacterium]|nr:twin-arginine translocase TatA/TatE family subunit [Candidatus Sulfomarinibacteraceae bacterium]